MKHIMRRTETQLHENVHSKEKQTHVKQVRSKPLDPYHPRSVYDRSQNMVGQHEGQLPSIDDWTAKLVVGQKTAIDPVF